MVSKIKITGGLKKNWLSTIGKSDAVTAVTKEAYQTAKQSANSQARAMCEQQGLRTVYDGPSHKHLKPSQVTSFYRGNAQSGTWNTTYTMWPTYRSSKLTEGMIQGSLDSAARATGAKLKRRH